MKERTRKIIVAGLLLVAVCCAGYLIWYYSMAAKTKQSYDDAKKLAKEKTANGINYRNFELKIFNIKLPSYETKKFNIITVKKKIKSIYTECIPNKFDETIYTMPSGTYFDGYFQNEKYLESIKEELKKRFCSSYN